MVNEFGKNYDFPVVDGGVSRGRFTKDCVIVGMICMSGDRTLVSKIATQRRSEIRT